MNRITLFQFESPDIKVTVEAYFEGEKLFLEGYDIGKSVEEFWGDSDYEYVTAVPEDEVKKLYPLMNVSEGNKDDLLRAIAGRFNTNTCYRGFIDFLSMNSVKSEGFSWT